MIKSELKSFPPEMKKNINKISSEGEKNDEIEGYMFDGADGSQIIFWECGSKGISFEHKHEYDEYMIVVQGKYTAFIQNKKYTMKKGDELFIPKNIPHSGEFIKNTRTIHWFGGKRAQRNITA